MIDFGGADPARTFAVVVGVEHYRKGSDWDLDGPALDAARFIKWLRGRHVPAEHIFPFIAALEEQRADGHSNTQEVVGMLEAEGIYNMLPPTVDTIRTVFADTLPNPAIAGDLLIVFWGGHGALSERGTDLRLFLSDATQNDRRNLIFGSLLEALRTQSYSRLKRQLVLVDTCANYLEDMRLSSDAPGERVPANRGMSQGTVQCVFYAAASGQVAQNSNLRRTGEFSNVILDWLAAQERARFPGDVVGLEQHLAKRFQALREDGVTRQLPVRYYWNGSDIGAGIKEEGEVPRESSLQRSACRWNLSVEQLRKIATRAAECSSMRLRVERDRLVNALPRAVSAVIAARDDDPVLDLFGLVAAALDRNALSQFFDGLALVEANKMAVLAVREYAERLAFAMQARSALRDVMLTPQRYYQLYLTTAPDAQTAATDERTLDDLLARLADMPRDPSNRVRPLTEFMLRVARQAPNKALHDWCADNVPADERTAANGLIHTKDESLERESPYLAVMIRTAALNPGDPPGVTTWLWRAPTLGIIRRDHACGTTEPELRDAVLKSLIEARGLCGTRLEIEFLVPREQFLLRPDTWELPSDGFRPTTTVGADHFIVLRWRERALAPDRALTPNCTAWIERIEERAELGLAPEVLWVSPAKYDFKALSDKIEREHGLADLVGLAFVPPEPPNYQAGDLLMAALLGGAPFICIPRDRPEKWEALEDEIRQSVDAGIEKFPRKLSALRRQKGSPLGECTVLLWDRPDHEPLDFKYTAPTSE